MVTSVNTYHGYQCNTYYGYQCKHLPWLPLSTYHYYHHGYQCKHFHACHDGYQPLHLPWIPTYKLAMITSAFKF